MKFLKALFKKKEKDLFTYSPNDKFKGVRVFGSAGAGIQISGLEPRTGMSFLASEILENQQRFKNTKEDFNYNMAFTKDESFFVSKGELNESYIKDWHFYLGRNLTLLELKVMELCSKNGVYLSENTFQKNK